MSRVVVDLRPPRGRLFVTPSWTMSTTEKAKAFPDRKKFKDRVMYFELTPANISYAKSAFRGAEIISPVGVDDRGLANGPRMPFKTAYEPTDLQVEAFGRARGKKLFAYFEKPGSGKTKMVLDHAVDLFCSGEIDGMFVFSYAGVHEQWIMDEAPKHIHPSIPWQGFAWRAGKKPDRSILRADGEVFRIMAMNYESYAASPKGFDLAQEFAFSGNILAAADESQRLKSDDSVISETAVNHREDWHSRLIASGEPTPLGIEDYYKQFCFLDPAIIGAWTFTGFKGMFCRMGGFENNKVIGYQNQEMLHEKMAPYVHVGAPDIKFEKLFEVSRFNLGDKAREAYEQLKAELMVEIDNQVGDLDPNAPLDIFYQLRSVLPMFTKLLEISCGRLTNRDQETIHFGDERIRLLDSMLSMRTKSKCIVWSAFKADHEAQQEMLGDCAAVFNGDTSKPRRREIVEEFLDPTSKLTRLLASTGAAGTGLNLQGTCNWNIYFSNNANAGTRWQSEMRTYRLGVKDDVLYQDIVARNTVDVGVLNSFRRKRQTSDMSIAEFKALMEADQVLEYIPDLDPTLLDLSDAQ